MENKVNSTYTVQKKMMKNFITIIIFMCKSFCVELEPRTGTLSHTHTLY